VGALTAIIGRIQERFGQVHSDHKRIATGALWTGLFVLAAKICVAGREIAIAWRYGTSAVVDAYQLALTVTTWVPMLLVAAATAVLVPRLVALRRGNEQYADFIKELNATAILLAIGVAGLTWIGAPIAVAALAHGFEASTGDLTVSLSRQMTPIAFFGIVAGYLSIRLQARENYSFSFAEAVPSIVIAALLLASPLGWDAWPLLWGTLLGFLLQGLWLAQRTSNVEGALGGLRLQHSSADWRPIYSAYLTMLGGQIILGLTHPLDQAFAGSLGEGAVASLGYASRLISLVTAVGPVVLARALLPVLADVAASRDHRLGRSIARKWSLLLLFIGSGIGAIGWALAPLAVALLFERGAFTATDTAIVADALRWGLIQLPFYFGGLALVQWIAALGRYNILLSVAAAAIAVKIGLNFLLLNALELSGIMAATGAMYALSYLLLYLFVAGKNEKLS